MNCLSLRTFLLAAGLLCGAAPMGIAADTSFVLDGGDIEAAQAGEPGEPVGQVPQSSPRIAPSDCSHPLSQAIIKDCSQESRRILHGLILDTAFIGGGAVADIWSTEYALARRPDLHETNPLGVTKNTRIWLKAGMGAILIGVSHKLRSDGHPGWAKVIRYGAFAAQMAFAAWNVRLAHQSPQSPGRP